MLDNNGILQLSATDLSGHLSCIHLTQLDAELARGARAKPKSWDPPLEILRKRGERRDQAYLDLREWTGYENVQIEGVGLEEKPAEATVSAMGSGGALISHSVLLDGRWGVRADILRRVETPSGESCAVAILTGWTPRSAVASTARGNGVTVPSTLMRA